MNMKMRQKKTSHCLMKHTKTQKHVNNGVRCTERGVHISSVSQIPNTHNTE